MSQTALTAALLGLATGAGLLLVVLGWRGGDPDRPRRWPLRSGRVDQRLTGRGLLAFGVSVVAGVLTGWVVGAVLAGLAAWALPGTLRRDPEHARRIARIEAIATWTEMLRDTLAAAAGLEQAILATASISPAAVRREITSLATRLESGDRLGVALRVLADELSDATADLVISSLVLASEQQARQLGPLLGSLAQAAREQAAMRMRVEVGRARIRTSVRVIVGTTLVFVVGLVLLDRSYLVAYDSTLGQLMLLVVGTLFAAGFSWLARIARVSEAIRFLTLATDLAAAPSASASGGKDR